MKFRLCPEIERDKFAAKHLHLSPRRAKPEYVVISPQQIGYDYPRSGVTSQVFARKQHIENGPNLMSLAAALELRRVFQRSPGAALTAPGSATPYQKCHIIIINQYVRGSPPRILFLSGAQLIQGRCLSPAVGLHGRPRSQAKTVAVGASFCGLGCVEMRCLSWLFAKVEHGN